MKNKHIVIPKGYCPSENEEYMNPMHQAYFRKKLEKWKKHLLNGSNDTLLHLKEGCFRDSDIVDRMSAEIDANMELRTRDRYRKLVDKIDNALEKIESGEYGYCEYTGTKIGIKRLEARPIATLCIAEQKSHERYERVHYDGDNESDT